MMSSEEIKGLKRQLRVTQVMALLSLSAFAIAATRPVSDIVRAKGIIIEDGNGVPKILIGAPIPLVPGRRSDVTTSIVFRDGGNHDRVILGQQPDPVIHGEVVKRRDAGWGMNLFNKAGDERGGMANFDNDTSAISLDRATGDAIGMLVDEKGGFSGFLLNYKSASAGSYAPAFQIGTKDNKFVGKLWNYDGEPAGSIVAGSRGPAILSTKEVKE
ncbi:hypothetical protein [Sphingomonas parapaucimobilis]|uniref:hypothetical protein n=1 Tax=Sphingomonas parapaucimobilis TaxID=28213 RepID=UPI0035C7BE1A